MMRFMKVAGIVVMALLLAGPASAVDMCFDTGLPAGPGYLLVVKGFKRPRPGGCRALTSAYEASTSVPYAAVGMACLNASGSTLYLHWSTLRLNSGGYDEEFNARTTLPYPSLTGGTTRWVSKALNTGDFVGNAGNSAASRCNPAPIP